VPIHQAAQLAGTRHGGGRRRRQLLGANQDRRSCARVTSSARDDLDPSSPYTPTSLLATVGAPGASRLCAATPIVLESHACLCDGVTAGAHAYFVWPARRARRPGGRRPERRARRAYVYVGRGGARRGHARGDRPGRCECRRGAARTGQWWWPAGGCTAARTARWPACLPAPARGQVAHLLVPPAGSLVSAAGTPPPVPLSGHPSFPRSIVELWRRPRVRWVADRQR